MRLYDQKERGNAVNIFNMKFVNKFQVFYSQITEPVMRSHY